jgi:hypothetical protein
MKIWTETLCGWFKFDKLYFFEYDFQILIPMKLNVCHFDV